MTGVVDALTKSLQSSLQRNNKLQDEYQKRVYYQQICQQYLNAIYSIAIKEGINMPQYPAAPYSESQIQIYYNYLRFFQIMST